MYSGLRVKYPLLSDFFFIKLDPQGGSSSLCWLTKGSNMQGYTVFTQPYFQIHIKISVTCFGPYGQVIASDSLFSPYLHKTQDIDIVNWPPVTTHKNEE